MKKGTSTKPEVFLALAQAYEAGNTLVTNRIESILAPDETPLPELMQNALDALGDTPLSEPKLYALLQKGDMDGFIDTCSEGIDLDGEDAVTVSTFISRIRIKILTHVDKDGVFKTTPNLDGMRLPKLSEVRAFSAMAQSGATEAELEKSILKTIGLEKVKLTEWEKDLAKSIVTTYTQVTTDALLGKATDKTPFARYLKNI